jgi:hypothetical protein
VSGQLCDRQSAQVVQALSHFRSIRQVTLVADWTYYLGIKNAELFQRTPVRLGPIDGSPFDVTRQTDYVAAAARETLSTLRGKGLRVSVLRQVPPQPRFNAEIAARASLPGAGMYLGMPTLSHFISLAEASALHADADNLFNGFERLGLITYVDTWGAFCSSTRCDARGGLSSDYVTSTRLSPSGALALSSVFEEDLAKVRTHAPQRRMIDR